MGSSMAQEFHTGFECSESTQCTVRTLGSTPVCATLIYHIMVAAHKLDISTAELAHHPNFSHMLYGCRGCQGWVGLLEL